MKHALATPTAGNAKRSASKAEAAGVQSRVRVHRNAGGMGPDGFNAFCGSLPHAHYVMQWGGAHVWKVAGKVFAIGSPDARDVLCVSFKCSDLSFEILQEQPGLRPAPYLASRGMKWIQRTGPECLDDEGLEIYLKESHRIVSLGLPKKVQRELGLNSDIASVPSKSRISTTTKSPRGKS